MTFDVINDDKLFPTVDRRIYCRNLIRYLIRGCVTKASALESNLINYIINSRYSTFKCKWITVPSEIQWTSFFFFKMS